MAEKKHILVVDDDVMSLRRAEFILKKTSHGILTAESGDECIQKLQSNQVDLLVLDVKMPEKDGLETLSEIRGMEGFADLPVIFLTGTEDTEQMREAETLGAKDFAIKPLKPQELINQVEKALG